MACLPGPRVGDSARADVFAFSGEGGDAARQWETLAQLWSAPWKAWWALAFEAMNPENYRR
jgi:hypothetical protein